MNASGGSKTTRDYGVFRRSLNRQNTRLTESTCKNCRSFVAASVRPELLDFIEKLHFCIMQSQFSSTATT
jgi:hypothetical protein